MALDFGGGGFFGSGASRSESEVKTTETGQSATSQEGAVTNISLSDLNLGRSSASVSLSVNQTDFGAITAGIEAANKAQENAYLFTAGAIQESNQLVSDASKAAFDTVQKQVADLGAARTQLLEFSGEAISSIKDFSTTELAAARAESAAVENNLFTLTNNLAEDLFTFSAGAISTLTGELSGQTTETLTALSGAQEKTLSAISEATKSESAKNFEKLLYVAGFSIAAIAGFAYYANK